MRSSLVVILFSFLAVNKRWLVFDAIYFLHSRRPTDITEVIGLMETTSKRGVWCAPVAFCREGLSSIFAAVWNDGRRGARMFIDVTGHIVDFVVDDEPAIGRHIVLADLFRGERDGFSIGWHDCIIWVGGRWDWILREV